MFNNHYSTSQMRTTTTSQLAVGCPFCIASTALRINLKAGGLQISALTPQACWILRPEGHGPEICQRDADIHEKVITCVLTTAAATFFAKTHAIQRNPSEPQQNGAGLLFDAESRLRARCTSHNHVVWTWPLAVLVTISFMDAPMRIELSKKRRSSARSYARVPEGMADERRASAYASETTGVKTFQWMAPLLNQHCFILSNN